METLNNTIPILVAFKEGGKFVRTNVAPHSFHWWRLKKFGSFYYMLDLITQHGTIFIHVPIIMTMNGFIYDKSYRRHAGQLLRERKEFTFDINQLKQL